MAGTLSVVHVDVTRRKIVRHYEFVPSPTAGQGYTTGGDTLNFLAALNPKGFPRRIPPSLPLPSSADFTVKMVPAGYDMEILPNSVNPTLANFLIKFYTTSATELSQADYPAGLSGKKVEFSITSSIGRG